MAYRAEIGGGSGSTGAELLRLLSAHPEIEVVHVTADSNAGSRAADLYPSLGAAYPDLAVHTFPPPHPPPPPPPPISTGSTWLSWPCPTASRSATPDPSSTGSPTWSTSAPTSGSPPPP